jgi:prolyl oligopeptidase
MFPSNLALWMLVSSLPISTVAPTLAAQAAAAPPATETRPVTDIYFATQVTDPYRWLEDASDPNVEKWNQAQNSLARSYLDALPTREYLKKTLKTLITVTPPSYSELSAAGKKVFALYNDPKFQQPMLVMLDDNVDAATKQTVLDPNQLDAAGRTAIDWFVPSHDGTLVAVSLSQGGSEDGTLHIFSKRLPPWATW